MKFEYKVVPVVETKVIDEDQGIVGAFVSVTGVVDSVKDRIIPGAYQKTLVARTPKGVWSHDWDKPVSKTLSAEELLPGDDRLPTKTRDGQEWPGTAGALYVETQFNLETENGRDAFSNVKFYGPDQEWCADEATEILTTRGWLRYDQVTTDDEAYVIDPVTLAARFEPILAVNVFEAKPRTLRHLRTGNFSSLTTADHRWLVSKRFPDGSDRWTWKTTAELGTQHAIFRSSRREDAPTQAKWDDAFVEVVAWYWNEGWRTATGHSDSAAYIGQSEAKNPLHTAAIRSVLEAEFPGGFTETKHGEMVHFRLSKIATDALMMVTDEHKAPTPAFLLSLTTAQLLLLIERCLDGDGHRGETYRRWYQVEEASVRRFEMACALAGVATNTYQGADYGNRHGRVPQTVTLLASQVAKPVDAVRVASYQPNREQPAIDALVEHDGIVWCPTTPSGTWMARREGTSYFTGNSIGYNVPPGASKVDGKTGVRELSYIDLYEYSPVLFGAMPLTSTAGFKDAQEAFRAAVKAGDATPDMVVEEEREEVKDEPTVPLVPVAEGFTEATEETPVTTPQDPIHQVTPGHTGKPAGVEVEPRLEVEGPPGDAEATVAKSVELVVRLSEAGEKATEDLRSWFAAEMAKPDHDPVALAEALTVKHSEILQDRANVTISPAGSEEGKAMVTLTGSYEERQMALRRSAGTVTDAYDLEQTDEWGYPRYYLGVEATFNNRVVYAAYDMMDEDPVRYFEASYAFDGQQATLKNPREVRVEAAVAAKGATRQAKLARAMDEFHDVDDQAKATTQLKVARGNGESMYVTVEVASKSHVDVPAVRDAIEKALEPLVPEAKGAPAPPQANEVATGADEGKDAAPEGEFTVVTLTDLLLLERLKLST